MKNGVSIAPTDLRDYAKARGWMLLPEAVKDRLFVLSHPGAGRRQLVFPIDTTAPDYEESVAIAAAKLAEFERQTFEVLVAMLQEVRNDTLRFRVTDKRGGEDSIPLPFAAGMITGAQTMLLASACTVLKPQPHHPRLHRVEAQQLIEASQFRHTEPGSFVLKISCPINALDVQGTLLPEENDAPFVRRTTIVLARGVTELVNAIEADDLPGLVERTKNSDGPLVSSNLCDALLRLHDENLKNSVDISVAWAATRPVPVTVPSHVRVQNDYFPRIEEVRRALRSVEKDQEDTFIGTVERLDGEMGGDGRRSGEVIVAVLIEGESVRARLNLSPADYDRADEAHMTQDAYVKVTGKLLPGRQPRSLTDVTTFELIRPKEN